MKKIILLAILFLGHFAYSQVPADSLNRYNSRHKKQGLWKVYLTDKIIETKDSTQAYYYAYDYYDNGTILIFIGSAPQYKRKVLKVESDGKNTIMGKPVLLNGNFKFYFKDGFGMEENYVNGLPTISTVYVPSTGTNLVKVEMLDYTKPYNNQFGSFYYEFYYGDGSIRTKFWFGKNAKGKWTNIK